MNMSREEAFRVIQARQVRRFEFPIDDVGNRLKVSEFFGINTLSIEQLRSKLSKEQQTRLQSVMHSGKKMDGDVAQALALAMKEWALEKGATHFCHWFQPQTGSTAEKHDAFLSFDDNECPIEKFSGGQLIQSEPDASSFPSGGMRTTFEARGYTAWDPTSPVFLMESANGKTLCIPSVFISYHGDALDEKTPLLRSMEVLNQKALDLLSTIGEKGAVRVVATLGPEQEYFLIDRAYYQGRPDLLMTGRTLLGSQPPRGQQLEDHYFGSVPSRALAFMQEMEFELFKLGVPAKTRHNEVAPSQFEMAPIFEEANVACDHNQLLMEVMRRVGERHQFAVLLHEKPFAGVNGSGKHNNWSMSVVGSGTESPNLLEPGKTPHQNLRFLLVLAAIMKGVHRHAGLLRSSIASPGNDHRLGANEAPPAIISVFLGDQLSQIVNKIEAGEVLDQGAEQAMISLGVAKLPVVSKDNTDRNRTSPFAFTGNKFEFRAVGSSSPCSWPVTIVNAAVAQAMGEITEVLKQRVKTGKNINDAILEVIRETFKESRDIRFEGNNYSQEWVVEAERRGLPNLKKAPEAIEQMLSASSKQLLTELAILSEAELHSRYHVMIERYVKKLSIELETMGMLVDTYVVPACLKEQRLIAECIRSVSEVNRSFDMAEIGNRLKLVVESVGEVLAKRKQLRDLFTRLGKTQEEPQKAHLLCKEGAQLLAEIRNVCDRLEDVTSDEFWPLPKYREMLFLS